MTAATWKQRLSDKIEPSLAREIDVFETQMKLRREGKFDEKLFAETRLRRGCYGQRYDNGQRNDGDKVQTLAFPSGDATKGPETVWDAPGMMRIKIPFGALSAEQLEVLAELAEEYSDDILHVTTRQDIQLHFVHLDDAPDMMRRLGSVGITTQEACGNSVRNVTACPYAGVCSDEGFDVSPYALALTHYLLGHPDTQDFGRKFKVAFSGCKQEACGLAHIHDIGLVATTRTEAGKSERGFEFYVGGGLGAVPNQAALLDAFVPEAELLPLSQAVCRIFARHGEKKNRSRARLKFVLKKVGLEEFRRMVYEERARIPKEDEWTAYLGDIKSQDEPKKPPSTLLRRAGAHGEGFEQWFATNIRAQAQAGYSVVTVTMPLGDFTADQSRALADIAREYTGDTIRLTVEQNLVLRWVSNADIPAIYERLAALGLGAPGAGSIVDVTACPGTDTCKLGISASRGLAGELRTRLAQTAVRADQAIRDLRIKVSGCFNSCGQHHVADLGFLGVSRAVGGRRVPHFQVVVGGMWRQNGGAYGLAVGAVPSKRIPEVVDRLTERFVAERDGSENFQSFIKRTGKKEIRKMLSDLMAVPDYDEDKTLYHDWGDPREYGIGDIGVGECAGEVVSVAKFGLADGELEVIEASDRLDDGDAPAAAKRALSAMLLSAKALIRSQTFDITDDPGQIVREFRTRFYDTKLFFDKYAGGKFAHYLFNLAEKDLDAATMEDAHHAVEEAQLFVEAAYACDERLAAAQLKVAQ